MVKNKEAYYRAIENMINYGDRSELVIKMIQRSCLDPTEFEVVLKETQITISLQKLFNLNDGK